MDATDEERTTDKTEPEKAAGKNRPQPVPQDDTVREFEEYLMEIGLRI